MKRRYMNAFGQNTPTNNNAQEPVLRGRRMMFEEDETNATIRPMGLSFGTPSANFQNGLNISGRVEDEPEYRNNIMYPLVPNSPPAPSLLFKCMKYVNENENDSYVYLKKPTEAIDYATMPIEEYNTMEELLENPGVYTWLLMENGDFIARKAFTPAEVFSKPLNIYRSRV